MPYKFIEDGAGNRFQLVEEVGATFDDGQWFAKGTVMLKVTDDTASLTLPDGETRDIPTALIEEPAFSSIDDLYNKLTAILY